MIILIVIIYGIEKLNILNDFGDSNLSEYIEEEYSNFKTDVDYGTSNFFFAFEIGGNLGKKDFIHVYDVQFTLSEKGDLFKKQAIDLSSHRCNDTDFDLYLPGKSDDDRKILVDSYKICLDNPSELILDGYEISNQR